MPFDNHDIDKLCELARLEVTADEIGDIAAKLSDIVEMVDQLASAPTEGVAAMAHSLERPQRLREDVVTETDQRELYQRNAPAVERGLYLVPKVIE